MAMRSKTRRIILIGLLCSALGLSFLSGGVFAAKRLYPYNKIVKLIQPARKSRALESFTIESVFHELAVTPVDVALKIGAYSASERDGKLSWGGGIVARGDDVIGVSNHGKFFLYRSVGRDPTVKLLDIRTRHNREAFISYMEQRGFGTFNATRWFRHIDIVFIEGPSDTSLILSHIYWHPEAECFTLRLSKLSFARLEPIESVARDADDWSTVYDSKPCLPIKDTGAPYAAHQAGGRMTLAPDGSVYLSIGDFQFDGFNSNVNHPQDPASDYGKIVRVDPDLGTSEIVSIGHRNPQGLFLDAGGNLWSTEHGPRGGDELNLIQDDANYGWPDVLYGTHYGAKVWPPSKSQGRHPGYRRPAFAWLPSIAVSNLVVVDGFSPEWDGDLLVSSLSRQTLFRMRYEEGRIVFSEPVFVGSRIRDLDQLADGAIVLWLDGGRLAELRIAEPAGLETADWMPSGLDETQKKTVAATVRQCLDCHSARRRGPYVNAPRLWEVYGRPVGRSRFSGYSEALKGKSGVWDDAALDAFLKDAETFAPGNVMPFPPLADEGVRRGVIAYLQTLRPKTN